MNLEDLKKVLLAVAGSDAEAKKLIDSTGRKVGDKYQSTEESIYASAIRLGFAKVHQLGDVGLFDIKGWTVVVGAPFRLTLNSVKQVENFLEKLKTTQKELGVQFKK